MIFLRRPLDYAGAERRNFQLRRLPAGQINFISLSAAQKRAPLGRGSSLINFQGSAAGTTAPMRGRAITRERFASRPRSIARDKPDRTFNNPPGPDKGRQSARARKIRYAGA